MRNLLILLGFVGCLFCNSARAAEMVNVEYIHKLIEQQWGITVPYNPALENPKVAANMKYLLTAVDRANKMLNDGVAITDYGNGEYATTYAADTIASIDAVKRLVKMPTKFFVTTTGRPRVKFDIAISAAGTFFIDWGDGTSQVIIRTDTTEEHYYHKYNGGNYVIGIGGKATGYDTDSGLPAISFLSEDYVGKISGCLGAVFPTIGDGSEPGQQPSFIYTFSGFNNFYGKIPENLFDGVKGTPTDLMFYQTFAHTQLGGCIPDNLFSGIDATLDEIISEHDPFFLTNVEQEYCSIVTAPRFFVTTTPDTSEFSFDISAKGTFYINWGDGNIDEITRTNIDRETYSHTYASAGEHTIGVGGKATGYDVNGSYSAVISFHDNLNIAGIDGSLGAVFPTLGYGRQPIFYRTFFGCANLKGAIPADLFKGVSGAPVKDMFGSTFYGCSGLTGPIPENLFAGISGAPAQSMFGYTFDGCSNLSGPIPENLFAGISGAPAFSMFMSTFYECSGLSGSIPEKLFAGISGAPASYMFGYTFYKCSGLSGSIPENLFAGISGAPASNMFNSTFSGCSGLTSIPENLFGDISGTAQYGMFASMFYGCTSLTGASAKINGKYLYEI
ncbi:hypothetical protein HDR61_03450, partial [bacterium]|nr:hypothetical protein [bacterium]